MLKLVTKRNARQSQRAILRDDRLPAVSSGTIVPPDILFCVFHYVTREELLGSVMLVCREWHAIAQHKQLWWHHTLKQNPYYFENRTVTSSPSQFFSHGVSLSAGRGVLLSPSSSSSSSSSAYYSPLSPVSPFSGEPLTPVSPSAPLLVPSVSQSAQLFHYKHYFYKSRYTGRSNNSNSRRHRAKKPLSLAPAAHQITLLNCRDYFFEQLLVSKFTNRRPSSSSNDGDDGGGGDNARVPVVPNTAAPLVHPPHPVPPAHTVPAPAPTPAHTPAHTVPAPAPAAAAALPGANMYNNNGRQQQQESLLSKWSRGWMSKLQQSFGAFGASSSSSASSLAVAPSAAAALALAPPPAAWWWTTGALVERDEQLEKEIVNSAFVPAKRYRHTLTPVKRGNKLFVYAIGGIKSNAPQQPPEAGEDEVYVLQFQLDPVPVDTRKRKTRDSQQQQQQEQEHSANRSDGEGEDKSIYASSSSYDGGNDGDNDGADRSRCSEQQEQEEDNRSEDETHDTDEDHLAQTGDVPPRRFNLDDSPNHHHHHHHHHPLSSSNHHQQHPLPSNNYHQQPQPQRSPPQQPSPPQRSPSQQQRSPPQRSPPQQPSPPQRSPPQRSPPSQHSPPIQRQSPATLHSINSSTTSATAVGFQAVKVAGKPPHLGKHTAVAYGTEEHPYIYIFGGVEDDQVTNNLYIFDLLSHEWHRIEHGSSMRVPAPRTNHQACLVGNEMYVLGGGIGNKMVPTNEVWSLNCDTLEWRLVPCTNGHLFTPRLGFVMTSVNKKLLIYGGGYWQQNSAVDRFWKEKYTDLFVFDTETATFTRIETTGPHPLTGTFPAHALLGAHWTIIGGAYDQEVSNEIYMLDLVTFAWKRVNYKFYGGDSLCAVPLVHRGHNKLLIHGGYCYHPLGSMEILKMNYLDLMEQRNCSSLVPITRV